MSRPEYERPTIGCFVPRHGEILCGCFALCRHPLESHRSYPQRIDMPKYQLTLNGAPQTLEVEADMPLLWALRDVLGLVGTNTAVALPNAAPAPCT